ncbi:hypothetical protein HF086_001192 [Spodoptera exigua]|uniref:Uncharacterized protein n=1 Tax=Spodoptera exigua TaxID=7107 RepID=A0A922MCS6_SPOEX|nr:hypothetical protein HF086_001192 [Spodoptera exigua]
MYLTRVFEKYVTNGPGTNTVCNIAVNEDRGDGSRLPTHAYAPRFQSRSATATPTTSPKKRQLPQIPHHQGGQRAVRAQVSADLEERKWIAPHHIGATLTYRSTPQGWERHYAGLSDSELAARSGGGAGAGNWAPRRRLSPDNAAQDSDLESVASVTSSAFSTQSERPRPTRMLSRKRILPNSTSSSCDSATPVPYSYPIRRNDHPPRRLLPSVSVPAGAERAVRRRLRSRADTHPAPTPANHRARPTRRLRRILARSRSAGSCTREHSHHRHAYERSHSCPEYPVYTNTYKITENEKDYIFHMTLARRPKPVFTSVSIDRELRSLPGNIYYGPLPIQLKANQKYIHPSRKKNQVQPESSYWHEEMPYNVTTSVESDVSKKFRRRRLPIVENITNSRLRILPNVPTTLNNKIEQNVAISSSAINFVRTEGMNSQHYSCDCDGTTNHASIKQNYLEVEDLEVDNLDVNKNESTETPDLDTNELKNITDSYPHMSHINRKKFLSLDLKTNYEKTSPNQTKSSDVNTTQAAIKNPIINSKPSTQVGKKEKPKLERRRNSDSLVILKTSPQALSTPDQMRNLFKRMSITSKNTLDSPSDSKVKMKYGNTVSINEVPTFQEYRSPNSGSPQSSIDLSFKKPLPSIIKKARTRSYSLAATYHLDREFSIMANSLSVALSPPNLGSPRRALTPVASHLPLDDIHHDVHDVSVETPMLDESTPAADAISVPRSPTQNNHHRCETNGHKKQSMTKHEKPGHRRNSKRSNDYGGRENGRGNGSNQQQQPLERRESRRGQFTRSLSNADVPPDEKAGVTFTKDGSLSDTALGGAGELEPASDDVLLKAEPRDYFGPGMGKKSNSTSQLSATGRKRRLGFGKRGKNSFTVQRSEEVVPGEMRGGMSGVSRASSASSENDEDRFAVFGTVDIDTIVWRLARGGRLIAR